MLGVPTDPSQLVRRMQPVDAWEVSGLHLAYLGTTLRGNASRHLLTLYYATIAETVGATGFVVERSGHLHGYACGVWDSSALRTRLVKRHLPSLMAWGVLSVFQAPGLLSRGLRIRRLSTIEPSIEELTYELRPIVVTPEARGSGVAVALVNAILCDAAVRGCDHVALFTEPSNVAAQKLYVKTGFTSRGAVTKDGIPWLLFENRLCGRQTASSYKRSQ